MVFCACVDLANGVENLPDDQRGEPERRFVEQQQPRPAHQRAPDRQHLLLAARQRAAALPAPFFEDRKQREHAAAIFLEMPRIDDRRADAQVFEHRHARKNASSFRRVRDPEPHDLEGRQKRDVASLEHDTAAPRPRVAADRHQQRRFAGAVRADDRDDLASADLQIDALQGLDITVKGMDAADRQHVAPPWAVLAAATAAGSGAASSSPR